MKPLVVLMAGIVLMGSACSRDGSEGATSTTTAKAASTTTSAAAERLTVLVTNDDGVMAPGIDAVVESLSVRADLDVVVVAPAENQSGAGGKTTAGPLTATKATTASGHPATAVKGYPADSVIWALGEGGITPDLVISGINAGQNIGPLIPLSGTVGAAREAAQKGVPSVAASQGLADQPDYPAGVKAVLAWLDQSKAAIADRTLGTSQVTNINVPTCATGAVQGTVQVPVAVNSTADINAVNCSGTAAPNDDVTAFTNGWVAVSQLAPTGSNT